MHTEPQPTAARDAGLAWPVAAFVITLLVYGSGVAPGLVGGDSPELIVAANEVGIPHQPGYPLYVLMGRIATILAPNSAVAVNALSALAGAVAAALGCALARRWGAPGWAALGLSLFAALGWPVWAQAEAAEVYTLGLAGALGTLLLFDRWARGESRLLPVAYVAGLAVSHHPLNVLVVGGIAVATLFASLRGGVGGGVGGHAGGRELGVAAVAFALPFTAFLVLPLRSAARPAVDYAQIESVGDFFYHALGVASRSEFLSEGTAGVADTATLFGRLLLGAGGFLTPLVLALGVGGLLLLARRGSASGVAAIASSLAIVAFSFVYAILDVENYVLVPWTLLVLGAAPALAMLIARGRGIVGIAAALLAVAVVGAFVANRARCDRSDYHLIDDFVSNVMAASPPRSALFLFTETLYTPFLHEQVVEGRRPDLRLVDMTGKVRRDDLGFRGIGGDWRENRWRRLEAMAASPPADLAGRPWHTLMFEPRASPDPRLAYRTRGLVTAVEPASVDAGEDASRAWSALRLRLPHPELYRAERTGFSLTPTVLRLYGDLGIRAAGEHYARGDLARTVVTYRQTIDVAPRSADARLLLASVYAETGRLEEAEREIQAVLEFAGREAGTLSSLGTVRLQRGDAAGAEALFLEAVAADPEMAIARANLGFLLARDPRRVREAAEHLAAFLRLSPDDPSAEAARRFLDQLRR